ncbi:hypothetical protein CC85DRAFT_285433 [Cutaneotrichosporon oleaginosum]|uniref:Rad21/Rec8-like protein N-terminal domain-containing protein n=1 Tax=Cutaneotrichosporon oleaginosum TaxID=879819 RepID=A0A0J0XN65_9TREE|nr:uncharacterized protein CC85DRAFT_285433 [Cutaneotrichosporon oleaginosum]KLT42522.1 hypothetical protein CC85DRAFT_285433 [Cutaneotrichosporon oleaginosum]TXT07794.1 hypothetical protein COLE_04718 [Cutaneotrichosporon oleaginosum]
MLLSELVLAKGGPLAKIWLTAHHERKLTKQQTLNVDIEDSCEAILGQTDDNPVALRISGQLMLGVTRIYGRQAQYLLEDCRDTRERITAFQPGLVDLPDDQIRAPNAAITLPQLSEATMAASAMDFWDWSVSVYEPTGLHTAPFNKTNIRGSREYGAFNFGRPRTSSIYGGSVGSRSNTSDEDYTSRLDSNEMFAPMDLGIENLDFDMSMEIGRGGSQAHEMRHSTPPQLHELHEGMAIDPDFSMGPMDLDLDFPPDELPALMENRSSSPASSALTTPPPASPPPMPVSPGTAKRLEAVAKRARRVRVLRPDHELELPDEAFTDESAQEHQAEPTFIPDDATAHVRAAAADVDLVLPVYKEEGERFIMAGPSYLPPALEELFTFPIHTLRRRRVEGEREESPKRPRLESEMDYDLEIARRRSRTRTPGMASMAGDLGLENLDMDLSLLEGDPLDLPAYEPDVPFSSPRSQISRYSRMPSIAGSRAESIARAVQEHDTEGPPLAIFDGGESAVGSQFTGTGKGTGGFSKTTGMAMGVLRREIEAIESTLSEGEGVTFTRVARGATKRAASQFFFELLVLGTRDAVGLKQEQAFGDIEVVPRPGLWETGARGAEGVSASAPVSEV